MLKPSVGYKRVVSYMQDSGAPFRKKLSLYQGIWLPAMSVAEMWRSKRKYDFVQLVTLRTLSIVAEFSIQIEYNTLSPTSEPTLGNSKTRMEVLRNISSPSKDS